jgi:hypothetical protein
MADVAHVNDSCIADAHTSQHKQLMHELAHQGRRLDMMQSLVVTLHSDVKRVLERQGGSPAAARRATCPVNSSVLTKKIKSQLDPSFGMPRYWSIIDQNDTGNCFPYFQSSCVQGPNALVADMDLGQEELFKKFQRGEIHFRDHIDISDTRRDAFHPTGSRLSKCETHLRPAQPAVSLDLPSAPPSASNGVRWHKSLPVCEGDEGSELKSSKASKSPRERLLLQREKSAQQRSSCGSQGAEHRCSCALFPFGVPFLYFVWHHK